MALRKLLLGKQLEGKRARMAELEQRTAELEAKGQTANYEKVLKEIQQRDYQDSHRAIAPLKQAKDAVKVDTSELDIDGVVATIRKIVEGKIGQ